MLWKADAMVLPTPFLIVSGSARFWTYRAAGFDCAGRSNEMARPAYFVLRMAAGCERGIEWRMCNSRRPTTAISIRVAQTLIRLLKGSVVDGLLEIERSSPDVFVLIREVSGC